MSDGGVRDLNQKYAIPILRWGLGLVVLIFGIDKFARADVLITLAGNISALSANPAFFVLGLGVAEAIGGLIILVGLWTKKISLVGAAFTVFITAFMFATLGVFVIENIAIFAGFIALYLFGPDKYSLDQVLKK